MTTLSGGAQRLDQQHYVTGHGPTERHVAAGLAMSVSSARLSQTNHDERSPYPRCVRTATANDMLVELHESGFEQIDGTNVNEMLGSRWTLRPSHLVGA